MNRLTPASSTIVLVEKRCEGVLVLEVDARLQPAAPDGGQGDLTTWPGLLGERNPQGLGGHLAQGPSLTGRPLLVPAQQFIVQIHRGAHDRTLSSPHCIKMRADASMRRDDRDARKRQHSVVPAMSRADWLCA